MQTSQGHRVSRLFVAVFMGTFWGSIGLADLGDPALSGNHPLTQAQAGQLLISELRCAACHTGVERFSVLEKSAPDLKG